MSNETALVTTKPTALEQVTPGEHARAYVEAKGTRAKATLRAYAADWRTFSDWMGARKLPTLPSDYAAVEDYLVYLAEEGSKVSSIERALSGLAYHHRKAGFDWFPPQKLRETMKAIRRDLKTARTKKRAVTDVELRAMIDVSKSARDRALLLLGWFAAMRRSEIVALDVEDVETTAAGLLIVVRSSKTDQAGAGELVGLMPAKDPKLCPVRALREHLAEAGIEGGPIFRNRYGTRLSGHAVAIVVQETAEAAGFDGARFGGHSLRAGFATTAAQKGVSEASVMRQGRWKNTAIMRGYFRNATVFDDNATKDLL